MEIEFTLKPEDFIAAERYHKKRRSVERLSFRDIILVCIVFVGIILGLGLWLPAFLFGAAALLPSFIGLLVGMFVGMLLLTWRQALINRSSLKALFEDPRNDWTVRDIRIVLTANEMRMVARGSTRTLEWSRVWRINKTDKHIFIYIMRDSAIAIPRRAFRDEQHFEEFIALARQYQQERGQQVPKATGIITALPPQSDAFTLPDAP